MRRRKTTLAPAGEVGSDGGRSGRNSRGVRCASPNPAQPRSTSRSWISPAVRLYRAPPLDPRQLDRRPRYPGPTVAGSARMVSAPPLEASPTSERRGPRGRHRSDDHTALAVRRSVTFPTRPRSAEPGSASIRRGDARPARPPRSRRASRARRPASSRGGGSAVPSPSTSASMSDFVTRFATHSTTSGPAISALAATAFAAPSVKPPAKIATRRRTTRSGSRSRSWPQSRLARSE